MFWNVFHVYMSKGKFKESGRLCKQENKDYIHVFNILL